MRISSGGIAGRKSGKSIERGRFDSNGYESVA